MSSQQNNKLQQNNNDALYDMLLDRLSKISGALRYKDKGISLQITGMFNSAGRFDVDLNDNFILYEKADYTISLQSFATTSSITNITISNNKFYFSSPSSGIQSITLPVGVYSIDALNLGIQTSMQLLGYYNTNANAASIATEVAGGLLYNINFSLNPTTGKAVLQIRYGSGYTVYFNQPNTFYGLLGFLQTDTFTDPSPNATSPINGFYYSSYFSSTQMNLINNVLAINIGCTLAEGSILITNNNNQYQTSKVFTSQIIASKPYIDEPNTILAITPTTPQKLKVSESAKSIRSFTVFCVDNNMIPQNFNSAQFVMNLLIEQV
jgi:hypothetical protein